MAVYSWAELIERFVVRGETPSLPSYADLEEPETYLKRLYDEEGRPNAFRSALTDALTQTVNNWDVPAINRAMRLIEMIAHADFAPTLRDIFFSVRGKSEDDDMMGISVMALRALSELQPTLPETDVRRKTWEAMWLALLDDEEYSILAYNGLRQLDISLALQTLPVLLRQDNLTPQDLGIILRGSNRDLASADSVNPAEALAATVAQLTEEELLNVEPALRAAFGGDVIDDAIAKAIKDAAEQLEQEVTLPKAPQIPAPDSLRRQFFLPIARWLRDRAPVGCVTVHLVDRAKQQVLFMAQVGIPAGMPEPSYIIEFNQYASGIVAASGHHRLFDFGDPESPRVYMQEEFLRFGINGLFSVYAEAPEGEGKEIPLTLVVNFFDASVEKLRKLQESCIRNTNIAARAAQQALTKYSDFWVAHLNTKLLEKPTLKEVAQTLAEDISKAVPSEGEVVALYLYHPHQRRLFLYSLYDSRSNGLAHTLSENVQPFIGRVGEGLAGYAAAQLSVLRISDVADVSKLPLLSNGKLKFRHLGLEELSEDQGLSYIGVPLREPAPSGFAGMLVGLVEMYRPIQKSGDRVFTPIGECILKELATTATPFLISAFRSERRFYEPIGGMRAQQLNEVSSVGGVNEALHRAEADFKEDAESIIRSWHMASKAERVFYAYRTVRSRCRAYWAASKPQFDLAERDARLALQQALLIYDDLLPSNEPGIVVNRRLLTDFRIPVEHQERLLSRGFMLVPLVRKDRLAGLVGLEFDSSERAESAAREIRVEGQDVTTKFVRNSMMRVWIDYRRQQESLLATSLEYLSHKAEEVDIPRQEFLNFVGCGRANLLSYEKTFGELTAGPLRLVSSDVVCRLADECRNWQVFAENGKLETDNIESVELLALPSVVRMVLATSAATMLWGGRANVSLLPPPSASLLEASPATTWTRLRISVPKNGNKDIKKLGLAVARGISEYRGWSCNGETEDPDGLTVTVPNSL